MHDNREDVRPNHLTRPQTEHLIPGAGCVTPGRCAVPGAGAGVTLESEGRATIGRAKAISNRTYEESLMSSSSIVTWPVPAPRSASCRVRWRHSLLSWAGGLSHWRRGADRLGDVRRPTVRSTSARWVRAPRSTPRPTGGWRAHGRDGRRVTSTGRCGATIVVCRQRSGIARGRPSSRRSTACRRPMPRVNSACQVHTRWRSGDRDSHRPPSIALRSSVYQGLPNERPHQSGAGDQQRPWPPFANLADRPCRSNQ